MFDIGKVWFERRRFGFLRGLVRERFGNRETWFGVRMFSLRGV